MKKMFFLLILFLFIFSGCIDVIRGGKSVTIIHNSGDEFKFVAKPELTVAADKDYADAFKVNTDASTDKKVTSEEEKKQ